MFVKKWLQVKPTCLVWAPHHVSEVYELSAAPPRRHFFIVSSKNCVSPLEVITSNMVKTDYFSSSLYRYVLNVHSQRHQSNAMKCKCISQRTAIWSWERPELTNQSQGTQCVLNWISPVWVRLLLPSVGLWPRVGPLGGPGTGLEDKELRADTQSRTSVLCSLSTRRNITHLQPASILHLPPSISYPLSSGHEPTHRGSNYPFTQTWMTLGAWPSSHHASCPSHPFSSESRGGWGGGERQALSQKWQYLFKVTSYSHAAESVPVNHTNSHRGWLLLRRDSWEQEKPTAACALLLLRYTLSFRPRPQ